MVQFIYSKCKVTSLLWFAHFGTRIAESSELLSCSHLVDHTSIPLIFQVNLIDKTRHFFLCITSFNYYSLKIQRVNSCLFIPLEIALLSCFKILWTNLILTSKLVHENPTLSEIHLKQPLQRLGKLRVSCTPLFEWCVVVCGSNDKYHIKIHV